MHYGYTPSGNLAWKDDYSTNAAGAYAYAAANTTSNGCGPHAANRVSLPGNATATYRCDGNGNVIGGTLTGVPGDAFGASYDAENHPTAVTRGYVGAPVEPCRKSDTIFCDGFEILRPSTSTGTTTWAYDPNGRRDYEITSAGTRWYGPAGYERLSANGTIRHVHELGPVIVTRTNGTDAITVVLRDRLGSTLDTLDGPTLTQRSYDAFGRARNGDMSDRPNGTLNLADTVHGFTGHSHADDVALIHMGGRIYDPNLGRFLSVDPIIHDAGDGQSLNPYSYLANRPLSGTDPTGYDEECEGYGKGDCTLTNVQNITVYKEKSGNYIAVAKDDQGNMVKVDSITKFSSNGAVTTTGITQQFMQAVAARDSTAIGTMRELGIGNTVFHGSDFMNHLAADYATGFATSVLKTGAVIGIGYACALSGTMAAGCVAGGLAALQNGDEETGRTLVYAGAGGGLARAGAATAEAASAQGIRGATNAEETAVDADVTVSASRYPESAQHIQDAQAAGQPQVLTADRAGAAARRAEALKGTKPKSGTDRDEYPPAMFKEGGRGASVRNINPSDNRGAGACIGAQCRGLKDGAKVRVTVDDGGP